MISNYFLVASKSEERTYYLFTPDGRELSFKTLKNVLRSKEANHVETQVARTLFKNNDLIQ